MQRIPQKLKQEILADPFYKRCALEGLNDHICGGRVTLEHTLIHAGRQVQKKFAIIPLCERGHAVGRFQDAGTLRKEENVWVALNRASEDDLRALSKAVDYRRERARLNGVYGRYPLYIENSGKAGENAGIDYGKL